MLVAVCAMALIWSARMPPSGHAAEDTAAGSALGTPTAPVSVTVTVSLKKFSIFLFVAPSSGAYITHRR